MAGLARPPDSSDSESEPEVLEERPEYAQGLVPGPAPGNQGEQEVLQQAARSMGPGLNQGMPDNINIPNNTGIVVIGTFVSSPGNSQPFVSGSPSYRTFPGDLELTNAALSSDSSSTTISSSTSSLTEHTNDIRFYYTSQLGHGPLPWVRTQGSESFTIDMVIKEISSLGHDVRAGNELDFREIFRDSREQVEARRRCCILVEGSPGYGKTTLARKIATDWGEKADYLAHFRLLVFVYCRDLRGRPLADYVAETFPLLPVPGKGEVPVDLNNWPNRQEILFVLDGLDECGPADAAAVNELLGGRRFPGASVLATSRPLTAGSAIKPHSFSRTVAIRGLNRDRIERLIENHFRNRKGMAEKLKKMLFAHQAYQSLVSCPLLCQLFCYIFGQDEELSEKVTDVYYRLIQNLIRKDMIVNEGRIQPADDIPADYEEALVKFGRLCIQALVEGKFYFTLEEISKNLPESMRTRHPDVIMGFLVKCPASSPNMFHRQDCYQPLHKTFLEYVSAFYLTRLVGRPADLEAELGSLRDVEGSSVEQVLLYTVEMLGDRAHHILSRLGGIISLRSTGNLKLLNAAGPCDENIKALTSVMDLQHVTVKASLKEIEAWRNISVKSDVIQSLKFQWDPKCDSMREEKVVEFFESLEKNNTSIEEIEMSMFHGEIRRAGDPLYGAQTEYFRREVTQFGASILRCMRKRNLKRFSVNFQVIQSCDNSTVNFAQTVVSEIIQVFEVLARTLVLEELTLNIDVDTEQMERLLAALANCRSLRRLCLLRLSSSARGYRALAALLTAGGLRQLELRLNLTKHWRRMAASIRERHGLESAEMLQDPVEDLGREAFQLTVEEGPGAGEEGEAAGLERAREEVQEDGVLARAAGPGGGVWGETAVTLLHEESRQEVHAGFPHLRLGASVGPLPVCGGHGGRVSGFHFLFQALKDRRCRLEQLHLSQCLFHRRAEYLSCLGEAVRANTSLTSLKLDNVLPSCPSVQHSLPLLLPLRHNATLTTLDLSSLGLTVQPDVLRLLLHTLASNQTLVRLDLSQWKFQVDIGSETLDAVEAWAGGSGVRELVLAECEFSVRRGGEPYQVADIIQLYFQLKQIRLEARRLETLDLRSLVTTLGGLGLRARDFLPLLRLPRLRQLDLSEPPGEPGGGEEQLPVEDSDLLTFFDSLRTCCGPGLQVLRLDNWSFSLARPAETLGRLKPMLQGLANLSTLSLNSLSCLAGPPALLRALVKQLPRLERLSLLRAELCPAEVPGLVRGLKARLARGGGLVLHTKHAGRCRAHPEHAGEDGLEELVRRLERSRLVRALYSPVTGELRLEAARPPGLLRRLSTLLGQEGEDTAGPAPGTS